MRAALESQVPLGAVALAPGDAIYQHRQRQRGVWLQLRHAALGEEIVCSE
jgi:hypothetical protein